MVAGKKRIIVDPPKKDLSDDFNFSGQPKNPGVFKSHEEWIQKGHILKPGTPLRDGLYSEKETLGILDGYDYEAWLASGQPF
jgi:hypothetical protein